MKQTNISIFNKFPLVDSEFDLISIDAIKVIDDTMSFYTPIIRYCIRDHEASKIVAGMTVATGFTSNDLSGIAVFVNKIVSSGLFVVDVSALGTIYTEDWAEIEEVNWNHLAKLYSSITDEEVKQEYTGYLH